MAGERQNEFIPVNTSSLTFDVAPDCALVPGHYLPSADITADVTGLPTVDNCQKFSVFRWNNPLNNLYDGQCYPDRLRSFTPVRDLTDGEVQTAKRLINSLGPFVPYPTDYYQNSREAEELQKTVLTYPVPEHQGRGFHSQGVYLFETPQGLQIKLSVCTKGSGVSGYWDERRHSEMIQALDGDLGNYPLNPDAFHARDHNGQSVGQKKGDDIVWVGCASWDVTKREIEGSNYYIQSGIYSPLALPVGQFNELPLATGEMVPADLFVSKFDVDTKLVYLAKAWANETRVWKNHFSSEKMTAAHYYSTKVDGEWFYEGILDDLSETAGDRRINLDSEEVQLKAILRATEPKDWRHLIGFAGKALSKSSFGQTSGFPDKIIPLVMTINMTENVARAGASRLWGKPVAWHFENIGRFGEVSGGERIYGKATGKPEPMEYHSFFAYLFDAYNAVAVEWASAGTEFKSFDGFYSDVKHRMLALNPNHWINECGDVDALVSLCKKNCPQYRVNFRSEDAYPLVAVPDTTDAGCLDQADSSWKSWPVMKDNMGKFLSGIRNAYRRQ